MWHRKLETNKCIMPDAAEVGPDITDELRLEHKKS